MTATPQQLPLIERIERALVLLACFIEADGEVHVPMYERFEAELDRLRRAEGTKDRSRRLLAAWRRTSEPTVIAPEVRLIGMASIPMTRYDRNLGGMQKD
jgi:hypothetical protein